MILADDNFATIVAAVREGRGDLRQHPQVPALPAVVEHRRGAHDVPRRVLAGVIGLDDTGEAVAVPLLATQILWINLLTDTAPALAMGVDPPPDDVMRRPPRRLTDRVIDREMWLGIVWVGLVMAVVTLSRSTCASPAACSAARATSTRRARWPSPRSCSPSSSTASTPARTARARSATSSPTAGCGGDRAVGRAAGRGRPPAVPERRVRHHSAGPGLAHLRRRWPASCCGPTRPRRSRTALRAGAVPVLPLRARGSRPPLSIPGSPHSCRRRRAGGSPP